MRSRGNYGVDAVLDLEAVRKERLQREVLENVKEDLVTGVAVAPLDSLNAVVVDGLFPWEKKGRRGHGEVAWA